MRLMLVTMVDCLECDGSGEGPEIQIGGDDSEYGPAAALMDVPTNCSECDGRGKRRLEDVLLDAMYDVHKVMGEAIRTAEEGKV